MKKLLSTVITVLACVSLLAACAPTTTPTVDADELATRVQQGIEQTLSAVTPTPTATPTATSIPSKLLVMLSNDTGNWQLYTIRTDGTGMARLTNNDLIEGTFDYSPDGKKIAFETYLEDEQNSEIYVMDADGSNPTRLTHRTQNDWGPVWSPDGTKILFQSNLGNSNYEVFVMNADGSNVIDLSNNSGIDAYPSWSPDGTRVTFDTGSTFNAEDIYEGNVDSSIVIVNPDGSGRVTLPTAEGADSVSYPRWSPDGSHILFNCGGVAKQNNSDGTIDLNPQQGVCVAAADGSSVLVLYSTKVNLQTYSVNYYPYAVWSPDGSRILFVGQEDDKTTQLYTMNLVGGDMQKLTNSPEEMKCLPSWSPDGTMITYVAQQGSLLKRKYSLYSMFADGSNITLLNGPVAGQPHPEWLE